MKAHGTSPSPSSNALADLNGQRRDGPMAENLLASLPDVLWSVSPQDQQLLCLTGAVEALLGHPPSAFIEDPSLWERLLHGEDRARLGTMGPLRPDPLPRDHEFRILRPDGSTVWLRERVYGIRNAAGIMLRIDGILSDVSGLKLEMQRLQRLNRLHALAGDFKSALARLHDRDALFDTVCDTLVERGDFALAWIGCANPDDKSITPVAQAFSGQAPPPGLLPLPGARCDRALPLVQGVRDGQPVFVSDLGAMPGFASWGNGSSPWRGLASLPLLTDGQLRGCLALATTGGLPFSPEECKLLDHLAQELALALLHLEHEEWLNYRIMYDNLTGLANRTLFLDRLAQLIHRRSPFAVLVFDVDRFKFINESLTYQAGDFLLQQLGSRLMELALEADLARPGGDDFALVLPDTVAEFEIARFVRERLLPVTSRPVIFEGEELRVSLKVGVACFPADGHDANTLLSHAEQAHRGAQNSSETLLFFGEGMHRGMGDFLRLETRLRRASEQGEFVAHFQPKIDLRLGRMHGVEALLRWNDPERGLIHPPEFIEVLEETGVILDIGRWMLKEAARQYLRWAEDDPKPPHIAVNISPQHLSQRDFIADVEAAVAICSGHPGFLELEITESSIMVDIQENTRKLRAVRDMGVEISMDDFGTGYSSLSYLTRLPLTRLKIDQSFIAGMTECADNLAIVSSIISLAHTLNLKVAAEGVETGEQLKFLKLLRCDEVQGFLFGTPLPAEAIPAYQDRTW